MTAPTYAVVYLDFIAQSYFLDGAYVNLAQVIAAQNGSDQNPTVDSSGLVCDGKADNTGSRPCAAPPLLRVMQRLLDTGGIFGVIYFTINNVDSGTGGDGNAFSPFAAFDALPPGSTSGLSVGVTHMTAPINQWVIATTNYQEGNTSVSLSLANGNAENVANGVAFGFSFVGFTQGANGSTEQGSPVPSFMTSFYQANFSTFGAADPSDHFTAHIGLIAFYSIASIPDTGSFTQTYSNPNGAPPPGPPAPRTVQPPPVPTPMPCIPCCALTTAPICPCAASS